MTDHDPAVVNRLSGHFNYLGSYGGDGSTSEKQARHILTQRQHHIDALEGAGILRRTAIGGFYAVVPPPAPHVHDWRVTTCCDPKILDVLCFAGDCHEHRTVPNRLPIEVPA